jgi:hypothetical protein
VNPSGLVEDDIGAAVALGESVAFRFQRLHKLAPLASGLLVQRGYLGLDGLRVEVQPFALLDFFAAVGIVATVIKALPPQQYRHPQQQVPLIRQEISISRSEVAPPSNWQGKRPYVRPQVEAQSASIRQPTYLKSVMVRGGNLVYQVTQRIILKLALIGRVRAGKAKMLVFMMVGFT